MVRRRGNLQALRFQRFLESPVQQMSNLATQHKTGPRNKSHAIPVTCAHNYSRATVFLYPVLPCDPRDLLHIKLLTTKTRKYFVESRLLCFSRHSGKGTAEATLNGKLLCVFTLAHFCGWLQRLTYGNELAPDPVTGL